MRATLHAAELNISQRAHNICRKCYRYGGREMRFDSCIHADFWEEFRLTRDSIANTNRLFYFLLILKHKIYFRNLTGVFNVCSTKIYL